MVFRRSPHRNVGRFYFILNLIQDLIPYLIRALIVAYWNPGLHRGRLLIFMIIMIKTGCCVFLVRRSFMKNMITFGDYDKI